MFWAEGVLHPWVATQCRTEMQSKTAIADAGTSVRLVQRAKVVAQAAFASCVALQTMNKDFHLELSAAEAQLLSDDARHLPIQQTQQLTKGSAKLSSNGSLCGLARSWHDGVGHSHQSVEALRNVQHWAGQHTASLAGEQSVALQETQPVIQCTACRGADC